MSHHTKTKSKMAADVTARPDFCDEKRPRLGIFPAQRARSLFDLICRKAQNLQGKLKFPSKKSSGGGFGGKETGSTLPIYPAVFVAKKLNRPVRCVLDREEDMVMTGHRHPYLGKYKVGFTTEGKILAYDVQFYSNAGSSLDMSPIVMMMSLLKGDNGYNIPNMKLQGYLCKTNFASGTAFRGFGYPQSAIITDNMMNDVADYLKMDSAKVRGLNLYQKDDTTHYNQVIKNDNLKMCHEECLKKSDYWFRREEIANFNNENRWKKRGLALTTCNHGISFGPLCNHQAGALVNIYADGTVLLNHGGVEMGQGLHTKMIQLIGRVLGIPTEKIHLAQTTTEVVPNSITTAASMSSDLYGMAIKNACEKLKRRLEPIVNANPKGSWEEWIRKAFLERISLSATGFYKSPKEEYDIKTNTGQAFLYYTPGACCSEVEIDCLTGEHHIIRTDIVMDVGQSLNPAIDIGQIEGGFLQGYGLYVLEELRLTPKGCLLTQGPGTYKIPSLGNIPNEFNVSLLKSSSNPRAVYSSKAIGEPPVILAMSVYFAIKDAIKHARQVEGIENQFHLACPATVERIRMACVDRFTKQFPPANPDLYIPWSVIP